MIRLGLHHLSVIQSLGATGNVSATALELGLTQSAVSHRMKEAERRMDARLFDRDGHRIALTSSGRRLRAAAVSILGELSMAERDLDHFASGFEEVVRLGAACYASLDWFPDLLAHLADHHPEVSASIIPDISEDPSDLVFNNLAEIVLIAGRLVRSGTRCVLLATDELVAVLPSEHRLVSEKTVDPGALVTETYVTHHTLPEAGHEYDLIFRPHKILPRRVICAGRTQAVLNVVRDGQAITILPRATAKLQSRRLGLVLRPLRTERTEIRWYGLIRRGERDAHVENVLDSLAKCLSVLAE